MKKKIFNSLKILFILFTFVVLTTKTLPVSAGILDPVDNVVNIAMYEDKNFSGISEAEPIRLNMETDSISLYAVCDDPDATAMLYCNIADLNGDGNFNMVLPFEADGSVTTCFESLPKGKYRVFFTGSSEQIAHAIAVFSVTQ